MEWMIKIVENLLQKNINFTKIKFNQDGEIKIYKQFKMKNNTTELMLSIETTKWNIHYPTIRKAFNITKARCINAVDNGSLNLLKHIDNKLPNKQITLDINYIQPEWNLELKNLELKIINSKTKQEAKCCWLSGFNPSWPSTDEIIKLIKELN